ncbi:unnamed protein product [Durusdinium trenchii]|uniref:Uncharacterized protein n=2 Tax=Durusdinium trenchii TaxID=1381693 RepID=A0ABP0MYT6_9DINO
MGGAICQCEKSAGEKVIVHAIPVPGNCCTNIQPAKEDSKGVLNQRLLAASRDNDIGSLKMALDEGAYLETRRPFVMRPKPPTSMWDQEPDWPVKRKGPKEGMTPLMYAAQNGSVSAVHMLLQARANAMAKDEDGMRPLHFAAQSASEEVCRLLVKGGADVSSIDDDGKRPVDFLPSDQALGGQRLHWEELLGPPSSARVEMQAPTGLGGVSSLRQLQAATVLAADTDNMEADRLWLTDEPLRKPGLGRA